MTDKISFWNFLKENEIEIPIIQRDYAQGRLGQENLRKNFLFSLLNALEAKDNTEMKLDFVYGSIEDGKLSPLDGQQRLTTLWLLHWYIALRAGKLDKDNCVVLSRFSYETRISSRDFCNNLCKPNHFEKFEGHNIVSFIYKQTWFYSSWKQDPTIQSMLRMLGGTNINDKKGDDLIDGIEELFERSLESKNGKINRCKKTFEEYWDKLISDRCPIVFYHLVLKDFGLSDDLYIKMNARGKQLTNFENFKADLIGYITNKSEDELCNETDKDEWRKLIDAKSGIPILLDTKWTDIFWKHKSEDYRIDEIYYAFVNRFFLNELICYKKYSNEYVHSADKMENNKTFKHLYGEEGNDSGLSYSDIDDYCYVPNEIPLSLFKSLKNTLSNLSDCDICNFFPKWVETKFQYIPQYTAKGITVLRQKERIIFLAVSRYFEIDKFEKESFEKWMRVVWNLAENANINSIPSMISTMRLIDELSPHSHNIYSFLSSNPKIKSDAAKEQVQEEIAKAQKIIEDCTWEKTIIEAEKFAFFKGAIRFLFTDGEGNTDWNDFSKKWENTQLYFNKEGVNDPYKKSAILLRALLSRIDISEDWFGNTPEFWRDNLLYDSYKSVIHDLLLAKEIEVKKDSDPWINSNHLLSTILKEYNGWHILQDWRGYSVLTRYSRREQNPRSSKEIVVLNYLRNKLLHQNSIVINDNHIIDKTKYLYGWDINFQYKENDFQWFGNPNDQELDVYLMYKNKEGHLDYLKRNKKLHNEETDNMEYFCFRVESNTTKDSFLKKLDDLISQRGKDKPKA